MINELQAGILKETASSGPFLRLTKEKLEKKTDIHKANLKCNINMYIFSHKVKINNYVNFY